MLQGINTVTLQGLTEGLDKVRYMLDMEDYSEYTKEELEGLEAVLIDLINTY